MHATDDRRIGLCEVVERTAAHVDLAAARLRGEALPVQQLDDLADGLGLARPWVGRRPAYEVAAPGRARRLRTLFRVTLPLSLPGLVAGCMLVFASSTTAFISQFVIGGNRLVYLPLIIWQQSLVVYNWPLASVAALTLLVSVGLGVAAIAALGRRSWAYAVS